MTDADDLMNPQHLGVISQTSWSESGSLLVEDRCLGVGMHFLTTVQLSVFCAEYVFVSSCFSLIHSIVTRVIRLAQNKSPIALAPALVETYSRLLVYIEIESLGIKGFISKQSINYDNCVLYVCKKSWKLSSPGKLHIFWTGIFMQLFFKVWCNAKIDLHVATLY